MTWMLDESAVLPAWRLDAERGARLAFSTRRGGRSTPPYDTLNLGRSTRDDPTAVQSNRATLLRWLGLENLATAGQVHGTRIVEVAGPGHVPDCDALLTTRSGLALAVAGADCMPLLFEADGIVGAAHAGWRGMAAGLPARVVEALAHRGIDPAHMRVHMGPCIRVCCYEVGSDVAERFLPGAVHVEQDRLLLDLAEAARLQLIDAGVPQTALLDTAACTACAPTWYFSHRRDAGLTGRQWGVAALL